MENNFSTFSYASEAVTRFFVREVAAPLVMSDVLAQEIQQVARNLTSSYSSTTIASFKGRLERGLELALKGSVQPLPTPNKPHLCRVESSDGTSSYQVDIDAKSCDCPDSQKGFQCKHRIAAFYYLQAVSHLTSPVQNPVPCVQPSPIQPLSNLVSESQVQPTTCVNTARGDQILKDLGYLDEPKKVAEAPEPLIGARLGFLYRKYLHGDDLGPKSFKVTITNITKEKVGVQQSHEPLERWCLWLNGMPQGMPTGVLFGLQGERELVSIFGRANLENLKGKVIEIYSQSMIVSDKPKMLVHFRKCA